MVTLFSQPSYVCFDIVPYGAVDDVSEGAVVQHKGRFKVFSADLNPKVILFSSAFGIPKLPLYLINALMTSTDSCRRFYDLVLCICCIKNMTHTNNR